MERLLFSSFSKAAILKRPKWHSASLINQWEHLYSDSYHSPEQNDTTLGGWWGMQDFDAYPMDYNQAIIVHSYGGYNK